MAFKDILLTLTSYPEPTPVSVVEDAVSIAAALALTLRQSPARCMFRYPATSCRAHFQYFRHHCGRSRKEPEEREGPARRI